MLQADVEHVFELRPANVPHLQAQLRKSGTVGANDPAVARHRDDAFGDTANPFGLRVQMQADVALDQAKWPLAADAGAAQTVDPSNPDTGKALMKATGGGVHAVVDFVGTGESFAFGFNALRKGGKMVSVGLIGGSTPVVPAVVVFKAVTIQGSMVGTCGELRELLAIAQTGVLPPLPVRTMGLESVNDVIQKLHEGRFPGRAVLTP